MRKKIGALLALFWVVCIGTAWGNETSSITLGYGLFDGISAETSISTESTYSGSSTQEGITFSFSTTLSKGKIKSGCIQVTSGSNSATLTISAPTGYIMTKIVGTFSSNKVNTVSTTPTNISEISATTTTYTWEGSSNSMTFNLTSGSSTNTEFKSVVITYSAPSGYSIEYDCNGADSGCPSNASNQTALPDPLPSAPTKTGHTFGGWYTNEGLTIAAGAGAAITTNTTLYAQWSVNSYTLAWDKNAEDADNLTGEYTSGTVAYGTTLTAPATPTRSGYRFMGWATSESGDVVTVSTMPAEDVTYYAQWLQNYDITHSASTNGTYTIKVGDADAVSTNTTANYGQTITLAAAPTTGYELSAWNVTKTSSGDEVSVSSNQFTMPAEAVTIAPTFTITTHTLTNVVNTEGYGTVSPTSVSNIPYGTETSNSSNTYTVNGTTVTATPSDATAEYTYAFDSWSNLPASVTTDATITANFTRTANSYTLAWNKNAEDADDLTGSYTSGTVAYGTALSAPDTPTRSGYRFMGWATSESGDVVTVSTMPAANTTYYAQWEESSAYYRPSSDAEVIILKDQYDASKTSSGYSNHAAISWNGTASTNSKKAGDPNNGGAATSSNVGCYNVKGNGSSGKNITLSIRGCAKITLYHESHASRYPQLKITPDGELQPHFMNGGNTSVYYHEFILDKTKSYSILLCGYDGSSNQDFYVYAIKLEKSISSVPVSIGSYKWGTFCAYYPLNFEDSGVSAYIVTGHSNETLTRSDALSTVPANTPLLVKAEEAGTYNIPVITSSDTDVDGNNLKAGTGRNVTAVEGKTTYVLSVVDSKAAFKVIDNVAAFVPVNKAYLQFGEEISLAPSFLRIEDSENNTTNVETIGQEENVVKFFENGVLYIKRDGIVYDVTGRIICK